jgi:hypothetical protein
MTLYRNAIFLYLTFAVLCLHGQPNTPVSVSAGKPQVEILPGQTANLPFFIENIQNEPMSVTAVLEVPENWKIIPPRQSFELKPTEKKFVIFTVQVPAVNPVGNFNITLNAFQTETLNSIGTTTATVSVGEVEKISLILVEAPDHVTAGEKAFATFLLQNMGNTQKKVFIETTNSLVEGPQEIPVEPGASAQFRVKIETSAELTDTRNEYYTVRALVSGEVTESVFRTVMVFPSGEGRRDLYFRFPVTASANYLASNQRDKYEHAYQFEFTGSGALDTDGKHRMEFLARGPNNANLGFLGLYDQYYISYENDNLELFAGEKSFSFTPLTESSRYGLGAESKVIFNNGLHVGFLYVKPRFFGEIRDEMAAYTGFAFNDRNNIEVYAVSKQVTNTPDPVYLFSVNSQIQPFKRTSAEIELSGGTFLNTWDHALRANINSQISVFNLAGNYYYTGKDYPGYFSNSTFYSGNLSARLSPKINLGVYAREDFVNAQLDTFFVTAPYSKSFQAMLNYNIASRSYVKVFWREYERKDRLALDKFHYKTRSVNTQFNQKFKKLDYNLLGEFGETTNFLLEPGKNRQNTYRFSGNFAWRFNAKHALRMFGSWSNINRFVSGEQRNLTAGLSVSSQIAKNLKANFQLQNAYNIEDYYRNRNLMQFNLDFTPGRNHQLSLRSFYTLYRQQTENPEFTFSARYAWQFGIPLKKTVEAGDVAGRITRQNEEPVADILISLQNRKTLTDKNGEFSFKSVPTGMYMLLIDRSNMAIDEVIHIPEPIELEVMEDQLTTIQLRVEKGARFTGIFEVEKTSDPALRETDVNTGNIIVELRNEWEQFRITTGMDGSFSFPMVRPGEWTFRIYTNSLPGGYEIENQVTTILLEPGQNQQITVELKPRKRNIIFRSLENSGTLQPLNRLKNVKTTAPEAEKPQEEITEQKIRENQETFYSVQIGAFRKKLTGESNYFAEEPYDFERKADDLYKYYIGKFLTFGSSLKERERLLKVYPDAFIVKFENQKKKSPQQ